MRETTLFPLIAFLTLAFIIQSAGAAELMTWYVDDDAPGDPSPYNASISDPCEDGTMEHPFDSIQEAINSASLCDTIKAAPGTYYENVVINKQLKLLADDPNNTIIDGGGSLHTVRITANNTHLEGFTIQNGNLCGLSLNNSHRNHIANNKVIENAGYGIGLVCSNYNTIIDCNVSYNGDYCIDINDSNNTLVRKNHISSSNGGIYIKGYSRYNKLRENNIISPDQSPGNYDAITVWGTAGNPSPSNNTIVSNDLIASGGYDGIYLNRTCDNIVSGNTIENCNRHGIEVRNAPGNIIQYNVITNTNSDNPLYDCVLNTSGGVIPLCINSYPNNPRDGIYLTNSDDVTIRGNEISGWLAGIESTWSDRALITQNQTFYNIIAIYLYGSNYCTITDNLLRSSRLLGLDISSSNSTITQNEIINEAAGIHLSGNNSEVSHNVFVTFLYNAQSHATNALWDYNFWSHYTGVDGDGDGIGDTPFDIIGGVDEKDYHPVILVPYEITTDPCSPQMKQPYLLNVTLTNQLPEPGSVDFTGAKQTAAQPLYAWGWELHPDDYLKSGPVTPYTIAHDETKLFQMTFTNDWQWIPPDDYKVIGDIICSLSAKLAGWSVYRFRQALDNAGKAVSEVTYTFKPLDGSSDYINFSADVSVSVPDEKVQYLHNSLINQIAAIATSACGLFPNPLSPVLLVLSIGHTLGAISLYDMAVDPDPDYTEIALPITIATPPQIQALPQGTAKLLALTTLEMISLQKACRDSYIRYDAARIAADEESMAKQLAAAFKYNAMATEKFQEVQFLTPLVIADANIPPITDDNVLSYRETIQADGLAPIQQYILEQAGFESQEPNIIQVICEATQTAEQRQPYTDPNNLYNCDQVATQNHYTAADALEDAAEAQNLTIQYTNDVAVTNIVPSKTSVCKGERISINTIAINQGSDPISVFRVTPYYQDSKILTNIPNGDFEKDPLGSYNNISDFNCTSSDQYGAAFDENVHISDWYYFNGKQTLESYVKSNEDEQSSQGHVEQWLSTANPVSTTCDYLALWIYGIGYSYSPGTTYEWGVEAHLTDGNNTFSKLLMRCGSGGIDDDFHDVIRTGADGVIGWHGYILSIPAYMDKSNLTIKILHYQKSGNFASASSWYNLDSLCFCDSQGNPPGSIQPIKVYSMDPGEKTTLTFDWDTTDVNVGSYRMKADAEYSDDQFRGNNIYTSEIIKVWVPDDIPPTDPCGLVCTDKTHNTISLAWNQSTDNVGIARYEVWRALLDDPCNVVLVGFATTDCTFTNIGLDPGTWYTYWVSAQDMNDNTSSLSNPCDVMTTAMLNLVYPNGGEALPADMNSLIQWETIGDTGNIVIEASINNGNTWITIDTVANTGSYEWHTPDILYSTKTQCLVRITDTDDPAVSDTSGLTFIIYNFPDIDGSCCIDFPDFAIVADQWSATDCNSTNHWCSQADLNRDGDVDLYDLVALLANNYWLKDMCDSPPS